MPDELAPQKLCLLALPDRLKGTPLDQILRDAIQAAGFGVVTHDINDPDWGRESASLIARADCIVADVTLPSNDVFFLLGVAEAMGKAMFPVSEGLSGPFAEGLSGLSGRFDSFLHYETTSSGLADLQRSLTYVLMEYRRFPERSQFVMRAGTRGLFAVDWDRLSREDFENLCLELLTQLGFHRVDWEKESPEIDIVAELPKKDPDGFEYRELWLVSLGRNAPPFMLLDMLKHEPDFFLSRLLRHSDRLLQPFERNQFNTTATLLLIAIEGAPMQEELFATEERIRRKRGPFSSNLRVRLWDRSYLTNLVYQFPQIGFKYFSDEGRAESKYRKTPEELYQENVELAKRLTATVAALTDEKNKRVRAERDAVWKDISFSAAHKMGNPIFAIETNLDPLRRRLVDGRVTEALSVIESIRNSVEKAKGIVAQFKSLTLAQQIRLVPTRLLPLLEDACRTAIEQGVICQIECPPDIVVSGDPERLGECFDELVGNALHWFDKKPARIEVTAIKASTGCLPETLDSSLSYVMTHFKDNGPGVPFENKSKIFDAFFTTYHHGTGLGLALVRRIIEGHGGSIMEVGLPGEGADFEMYLPLSVAQGHPLPNGLISKS